MLIKFAWADQMPAGFVGRVNKVPVSDNFFIQFNFTVNPNILKYHFSRSFDRKTIFKVINTKMNSTIAVEFHSFPQQEL